jgi:hypothetical protein
VTTQMTSTLDWVLLEGVEQVVTHLITKVKQCWAWIVLRYLTTQIKSTRPGLGAVSTLLGLGAVSTLLGLGADRRCWTYRYPFDHRGQAALGSESTWIDDQMSIMPVLLKRYTRILWPWKASEKTQKIVIPHVCGKYRRTPQEKIP